LAPLAFSNSTLFAVQHIEVPFTAGLNSRHFGTTLLLAVSLATSRHSINLYLGIAIPFAASPKTIVMLFMHFPRRQTFIG
jgi:hypothetical protein